MGLVVIVLLAIVLLLVLGWVVVGLVLKLLWWVLLGLVVGAVARALLPGRQSLGLLATALAGIAGALLGGIVADVLELGRILQFVAAVGAAMLIVAVLEGRGRTARA